MTSLLNIAGNIPVVEAGGQSLRFEDGDSAYLSWTPASAGNRKTWTWSGWVKRGNLGISIVRLFNANDAGSPFRQTSLRLDADQLRFYSDATGVTTDVKSSAVYRDSSAWYHIVLSVDTTQATASNRVKMYVNSEQITSLATSTYPSQNLDMYVNEARSHQIGASVTPSQHFDGYLANVCFIDGTALDPTSFGEYEDTLWKPKPDADIQSLTFGTNGFYLNFEDSSAIGDDTSGNSNDWTANNLAATDVVPDSPVTGGNFATLNPLDRTSSSVITLSEGNLRYSQNNGDFYFCGTTFNIPQSGKWYAEARVEATAVAGYAGMCFGFSLAGAYNYPTTGFGNTGNSTFVYQTNGISSNTIRINSTNGGGNQNIAGGTAGDIVQFAFDADTGKCWFGSNGTWYGGNTGVPTAITLANLEAGSSPIDTFTAAQIEQGVTIMLGVSDQQKANGWRFNAGADSSFQGVETPQGNTDDNGVGDFYYAPPSGYLALTTGNLPTPDITAPDEYFNTVLYSGNGTSQSITGVGFSPDFLWLKERSSTSHHQLFHDMDGGVPKFMQSSSTIAEVQDSAVVSSFDSDGFSVGNSGGSNQSGQTYVGWNWYTGATPSSNTSGSITSQVSANTDAGFSIVSYTGTGANATVGHGLSSAPEMLIIKKRDVATDWMVYNQTVGNDRFLYLNLSNGQTGTDSTYWNNTSPTSSVIHLGTYHRNNSSTEPYICYAFHSVEGYSKIGSYTGSGGSSGDGTFVHCGFRPSWVMIKWATGGSGHGGTGNWIIKDNKRLGYNPTGSTIEANLSAGERASTHLAIDLVSNGFRMRTGASDDVNSSGGTYVFYAVAEAPFKSANAR